MIKRAFKRKLILILLMVLAFVGLLIAVEQMIEKILLHLSTAMILCLSVLPFVLTMFGVLMIVRGKSIKKKCHQIDCEQILQTQRGA